MQAGAGDVEITSFDAQRQVVPDKPAHPGGRLQVKFKSVGQIRSADGGRGQAGPGIKERHPTRAGHEAIPQVGSNALQGSIDRSELTAAKQFHPQFPITTIPVAFTFDRTQRVTISKIPENQIVTLPGAKHLNPIAGGKAQLNGLNTGVESFADAVLPNVRVGRF